MYNKSAGVSLTEIIVVIAIISILVGVAIPNYTRLKQENRRADAQAALIGTQAVVERYLSENNKFNLDDNDMALDQFSDYDVDSSTPVISTGGYYRITIIPDGTGYTLNATATVNGGLTDCSATENANTAQCPDIACRVISIDHGAKQSTNSSGADADANTTECW